MKKVAILVGLLYLYSFPIIAIAAIGPPSGEGPLIINEFPKGTVILPRPTISATIVSPIDVDIDLASIELQLDDSIVAHLVTPSTGGSEVTISFTPTFSLSLGIHTVTVNARDVEGIPSSGLTWTFRIVNPQIIIKKGIIGEFAEINGVTVVVYPEIEVSWNGTGWEEMKIGIDEPDLSSSEWQPFTRAFTIHTEFSIEDAGLHYIYAKLRRSDGEGGWVETEGEIKDKWIYNNWYVISASGEWVELPPFSNSLGSYAGKVDTVLGWILPEYAYEVAPLVQHSILYVEQLGLRHSGNLRKASDFDYYTNLHYYSNGFMGINTFSWTLPYIGAPVTVFTRFINFGTLAEFTDYYLWGSGEVSQDQTKQIPQDKITTVAEPINVANGNMFTSQTDILIPAKEISLELSRTYNSQDDFAGSFGYGWRSNYDITLEEPSDQFIIEIDEKGIYTLYTKNPDGLYTASAGKYSKLTKNPDGSYTILRKHGRNLFFNSSGRLTRIEERNGNFLDIFYNSQNIINEIFDSSGRKLIFTSNSQGKITQVKDSADRIFEYEYDSHGNLIKTIDPVGTPTLYLYDDNHNLIQQTDANEYSFYFEYDSSDRAYLSWQDGSNNEVTLSFDPTNKTTTSTDSLGNVTIYEYNDYGLVSEITDAQNNIRTFTWDENFNKTSFTNENRNTTHFTYDSQGNPLIIKDPQNNITTFTYEPDFNLVSSITDPLTYAITYSYDERGNLIQTKDAQDNTTTYTYDTEGNLISLSDARGNQTNYEYDEYGNLTQITDPLGNQTLFSYDLSGNCIKITDTKGSSTEFTYDGLNKIIQTIYADGSRLTYTYDATGNRTSITDPKGNTTQYLYDEVNRLTRVIDAQSNTTTYTYDTEGNRIAVTDAHNNSTQYIYDSLNRMIKTIAPLGNRTLFSYDPVGNLISKTDANNNTIYYTYNVNNRLTEITYSNNSTVNFQYDAAGKRISMNDSSGTTQYTYDSLSHLIKVDGLQDDDTITYTYDKAGNRISMTNQDAGTTTYTYDSLNRLTELTDPAGKKTKYEYDALSNLTKMKYPNKTTTNYTFNQMNRLINLTNENKQSGDETISSYTYDYDSSGMRTKVTLADGDTIEYTYDPFNQLISETKKKKESSHKTYYSYQYEFDSLGNRTKLIKELHQKPVFAQREAKKDKEKKKNKGKKEKYKHKGKEKNKQKHKKQKPSIFDLPGKTLFEYAYNQENQLTQVRIIRDNKTYIIDYQYDNNGNLIKKTEFKEDKPFKTKIITYTYDYENRLTKITHPDNTTSKYTYDGAGKRIKTEENNKTTQYFYDGLNVIIERDKDNNTKAAYTRGLSYGGGIGSIISRLSTMNNGLSSTYYHYNGIGSATDLTDSRGQTVQSYAYDAYGNVLSRSKKTKGHNKHNKEEVENLYQFSTKEYSPRSGLIYFGARYYDPRVGRWTQPDPLGMIDGPNLYVYARNNPVNFIDPWGLKKKDKDKWRKEVAWRESPFWDPSEKRRTVWKWEKEFTKPYGSLIEAGYVGPVELHWRNRRRYEQWGKWIWSIEEFERKWGYKWGVKTEVTRGNVIPFGPYHISGTIAPLPIESPNP